MKKRNQSGSMLAELSAGVLALVLGLALLAGLGIASWKLNWFVAEKNADRQAHIIRRGYSNQETLREEMTKNIAEVNRVTVQIAQSQSDPATVQALVAQRAVIVNIVCDSAAKITGDKLSSAQQAQWVQANCEAGSISPSSEYQP